MTSKEEEDMKLSNEKITKNIELAKKAFEKWKKYTLEPDKREYILDESIHPTDFLRKYKDDPTLKVNTETNENVIHFLAREGKLGIIIQYFNPNNAKSDIAKSNIANALEEEDVFGALVLIVPGTSGPPDATPAGSVYEH